MKKALLFFSFASFLMANDFYYEYGQKVELEKISKTRSADGMSYYQTPNGKTVGVLDTIIAKCEKNCTDTLNKYSFKNISKLSDTLYLLQVSNQDEVFTISQQLHNEENIEFAHPNFSKEKTRR